MEKDFNPNYPPSFMDYNSNYCGMDFNEMYKDPMFNPIMQYEQAYFYYRYLCMQMDYKMKSLEYDKMCNSSNPSSDLRNRKIE